MEVKYLDGDFNINDYTNLVVLDFFADWCSPCKRMSVEIDNITSELPATILKVNADHHQELAAAMEVKSLPTLIFMRTAEPGAASKIVGFKTREQIVKLIEDNL